MSVVVRPFADDDADSVAAILDAQYGHDAWLRSLHDDSHGPSLEDPFRRTLVADADGEVAAAGTILYGPRHPLRTWLELVVASPFRRRGIGTALLRELRDLAGRPLRARGRFDDDATIAFLDGHGFKLLDRSWEGRFDPAAVVAHVPAPRLVETPSLDEAAAFFERLYQDTHHWDPPAPRPLEVARAVFCGENLIPGSLVGVRESGRLIGAGNLIQSPGRLDSGDELYLVWVGTLAGSAEAARDVVAACVRFALEAGKAIRFEVNEANAPVRTELERLGVLGAPAFGTLGEDL